MLLNDKQIWELIQTKQMIKPAQNFLSKTEIGKGPVISYGLSSAGYDIRVADEFYIFTNLRNGVVDPKDFDTWKVGEYVKAKDHVIIPPHGFALARSLEYIKMPSNVVGVVEGKSTYARCGIVCQVTPLEPGWEGHITLEIANCTPLPAKVYAGEGLCQIRFHQIEEPATSYADRNGKYQGQMGITFPKV